VAPQARSSSRRYLIAGAASMLVFAAIAASRLAGSPRTAVGHAVNGVVAVLDLRPAQAADAFAGFVCAGVSVGQREVMTAAHCVVGRKPSDLAVGSGLSRLCGTHLTDIRTLPIDAIEIAPGYDAGSARSDLALLRLGADIDAGAVRKTTATYPSGQRFHAFGWGSMSGGTPGCDLLRTEVRAVDPSACSPLVTVSRTFDPTTMSCGAASDPSADTCHGDSGGPLIEGDADAGLVTGIVSWGNCRGLGAYARIDSWNWTP